MKCKFRYITIVSDNTDNSGNGGIDYTAVTLQAFNLFPLVLRKLLTNISLLKPKNKIELDSVRRELINLNEQDVKN